MHETPIATAYTKYMCPCFGDIGVESIGMNLAERGTSAIRQETKNHIPELRRTWLRLLSLRSADRISQMIQTENAAMLELDRTQCTTESAGPSEYFDPSMAAMNTQRNHSAIQADVKKKMRFMVRLGLTRRINVPFARLRTPVPKYSTALIVRTDRTRISILCGAGYHLCSWCGFQKRASL